MPQHLGRRQRECRGRSPTQITKVPIFASLAEFERELIIERTRAGLAAARARGRLGGRPRKMDRDMLRMAMTAMANPDTRAADLARRLGITTTTLYMYVNGDGSPKAPGKALLDAVS